MTGENYRYEGADILQLSDALSNYNMSIAKMVVSRAFGAKKVLDFGAGIGSLSAKVRSLGLTPLCLEPDARQRAELQSRGFVNIPSLDEIEDHSLEFIYSSNVLEHIEDDVAALCALRAKLTPHGRLLLYIPAFQSLYSSMDANVGHWRRYEKKMLAAKLRNAGYRVDEMFYADVLGFFATHAYKLLGNDASNINSTSLRVYDQYVFPVGSFLEQLVRFPFGKNVVAVATNS